VCEGRTTVAVILRELKEAGFAAYAFPAMGECRRSAVFQLLARVFPGPFFRFHLFDENSVFVATRERVVQR
jgi:hypothetical protein